MSSRGECGGEGWVLTGSLCASFGYFFCFIHDVTLISVILIEPIILRVYLTCFICMYINNIS